MIKGEFAVASLTLVLVLAIALVGLYDLGLNITGFATVPGWAEMTIQACAAESNTNKGVFDSACDGTYPSACGATGDLLNCNDSLLESHRTDGSCPACYTGVRIALYNSSVTNCSSITDVFLCYEWWGDAALSPTDCDVSVDNQNKTNFTAATTTCPGTTADPGVTCINVTNLKTWTCSNFFGASGNRSNIKSELRRSTGGNKLVYWDVLFYNVTYSTTVDTAAPQWSSNKTAPTSPATYSSVQSYQFNVTWTDDIALSAVSFEHNFTGTPANYSPSGNASGEYYYDYGPLAVGTYYWKSYANDTSNKKNATSQFAYVVNREASTCSLIFAPTSSQTYGTDVNASCACTNPEAPTKLYRNGTDVTAENGTPITLPAGDWFYNCTAGQTQNYTYAENTSTYTIDNALPTLTLTVLPSSTVGYGVQTNVSCTASTPQVSPQLFRNGSSVNNPDNQTLAAGIYNYTCNSTATQNYTAATTSTLLTVNKAASVVNLTLDGIDDDTAVSVNQSVNITGSVVVPSSGYIELYDNGTRINPGSSPLTNITSYSSEGIHNITVVYNTTQNYTESFETHYINVTKVPDTTPPTVALVSPTPVSGTLQNTDWVFVNATAIDSQSTIDACKLEFGTSNLSMTKVGSGLSVSCYKNNTGIADGTYSYRVFANDTENNTGVSPSNTITIDTTPPVGVTALAETATGENWINWAWTNPSNSDFNHTEVWLNGTFKANVSAPANSYNATSLAPNTTYQIQTHTVDDADNINTTWVSDTATTNVSTDTTSPVISSVRNGTVTNSTALILWDTDDFSNSTVLYGTSPGSLSLSASNVSFAQNHTTLLSSLTPNTTYFYNVSSCSAGGCNTTGTFNFTTFAAALLPDGSACTAPSECAGGFCVHGICRSTVTYCNDGFCDSGESCSSCSADCGSCPHKGGGIIGIPPPPAPPPAQETVPHAERDHMIVQILSAHAGFAFSISLEAAAATLSEISIVPSADIDNASIEFVIFDVATSENLAELAPTHTTESTFQPATYVLDVAEFAYSAFGIEYAGFDGDVREVLLKFKVDKRWVQANTIDVTTVMLKRLEGGQWKLLETYLTGEDSDNYYYLAISPGLSTFAVVATSPPLLCGLCKPSDWSACIDGEQTRMGQDCGSHNGYTCRPIVESRSCEVTTVPAPVPLPIDIIIIPVVGLAVGSYLIFAKKKW